MTVRLKNTGLRFVHELPAAGAGGEAQFLCIEGGGFADVSRDLADELIAAHPGRFVEAVVPVDVVEPGTYAPEQLAARIAGQPEASATDATG